MVWTLIISKVATVCIFVVASSLLVIFWYKNRTLERWIRQRTAENRATQILRNRLGFALTRRVRGTRRGVRVKISICTFVPYFSLVWIGVKSYNWTTILGQPCWICWRITWPYQLLIGTQMWTCCLLMLPLCWIERIEPSAMGLITTTSMRHIVLHKNNIIDDWHLTFGVQTVNDSFQV